MVDSEAASALRLEMTDLKDADKNRRSSGLGGICTVMTGRNLIWRRSSSVLGCWRSIFSNIMVLPMPLSPYRSMHGIRAQVG